MTSTNPHQLRHLHLSRNTMAATMGGAATVDDISTKVEDYLNDKLQTPADLDGIESLLSSVKDQHSLLQRQVRNLGSSLHGINY